jgi:hypothetical protein
LEEGGVSGAGYRIGSKIIGEKMEEILDDDEENLGLGRFEG